MQIKSKVVLEMPPIGREEKKNIQQPPAERVTFRFIVVNYSLDQNGNKTTIT